MIDLHFHFGCVEMGVARFFLFDINISIGLPKYVLFCYFHLQELCWDCVSQEFSMHNDHQNQIHFLLSQPNILMTYCCHLNHRVLLFEKPLCHPLCMFVHLLYFLFMPSHGNGQVDKWSFFLVCNLYSI